MKKKDIIVVAICVVVIAASLFFIFKGFAPKSAPQTSQNKENTEFSGDIDKDAIEKIKNRKDYGTPTMDNIGRENPFASL